MPGLAAVVIVSLGVGIGVNTAVFSWIQAMVLQPIPGVADAGSYQLIEPHADTGSYPGSSWLEYRDLHDRLHTLRNAFAFRMVPFNVGDAGRPERTHGLLVSGNYFQALAVTPALGRFIRDKNLFLRRIPARMFIVLGPLMLLLVAIGLYAVVSYSVSRRTTEIGVRLALGATARRVVSQIVRETLTVVGAGALAGWLLMVMIALHLLGGVISLPVFIGVPAILLLVAALASWLPARRDIGRRDDLAPAGVR